MKENQMRPNLQTFNAILFTLFKMSRVRNSPMRAMQVLNEMKKLNIGQCHMPHIRAHTQYTYTHMHTHTHNTHTHICTHNTHTHTRTHTQYTYTHSAVELQGAAVVQWTAMQRPWSQFPVGTV